MKSPRLWIAAAIVILGLLSYWAKRSVNPITGETQHVALTADQEVALGMQSVPAMSQQFGGDDPDIAVRTEVTALGERLVQNSDAGKSQYRFQFHALNDPNTINAFALPGGPVFITRGLLNELQNEGQLAGVLGHEIGHVIARHAAEQMAKSQLAQMLVGATAVAASEREGHGNEAAMLAAFAAQMAQLRYSRKDELEADTLGVRIMSEAGYDPRALLGVMQILARDSRGGRQPEFLSTHPDPGNRADKIRAAINQRFPSGVPSTLILGKQLAEQKN